MGTWSLPNTTPDADAGPAKAFIWPPRPAPATHPGEPSAEPTPAAPAQARPSPANRPTAPASRPAAPFTLASAWADIERTWLDLLAPPLADRMLEEHWIPDDPADYCPRCGLTIERDGRACGPCRSGEVARPPWQRIFRLGEYTPPLSRWVCEVKFSRSRRLGLDLGRLLGDALVPTIQAARARGDVPDGPPLIVPVPMSFWRRMSRGIDHTTIIARGVAARVGGRVVQPLHRDHRPSQTSILPSTRASNVARSIRPRWTLRPPDLAGRLVIVVDDVTTTTATLRAACRGIGAAARSTPSFARTKGNSPAVWAAVIARTPRDGHDHPLDE